MPDGWTLPLRKLTLCSEAGIALWLAGPADPDDIPRHLWSILSSAEKDQANRIHRAESRALFALTRAALRYVLSEATGVLPQDIVFAKGSYGKPLLAGAGGPQFNVSHSGAFALIGLSASRPIGVDIEAMRAPGDELKLARGFFTDAEYRALEKMDDAMLISSFYKIWTCKEAILKAYGCGISEHLKEFSVELANDGYTIHPEPFCFSPKIDSLIVKPVEVPQGYVGCCALA